MNIIGLDVGFARDRPTSGVARLDDVGLRLGHATSGWVDRKRILGQTADVDLVAIDAPLLPDPTYGYRDAERLLSSGLFQRRCKPGASHVAGTGQSLRRAGGETAQQFAPITSGRSLLREFPRVWEDRNTVEAFPNAFLGVCLDDSAYGDMPALRRGEKFDWLYNEWRRADLFHQLTRTLDLTAVGSFCEVKSHHDERAALVCLITAAVVVRGQYVAVGEEQGGYIFLAPWSFWSSWARRELDRQRKRVPSAEVWIDGVTYMPWEGLPEVTPESGPSRIVFDTLAMRGGGERSRVDPENRYPAPGLRAVEANALRLLDLLPDTQLERTRDVIQLIVGDQMGIVLVVTAEGLEFRLPTVDWTCDSHGPVAASRLWKRVEWSGTINLYSLLRRARRARQQEFRECRYCGRRVPPEHRYDTDVCCDCASTHLGIVY